MSIHKIYSDCAKKSLLTTILILTFLFFINSCAPKQKGEDFAYLNHKLTIEQRVEDLVGRMTLDEKIEQMVNQAPAIERLGIPEYNWWGECLHGVARAGLAAVETDSASPRSRRRMRPAPLDRAESIPAIQIPKPCPHHYFVDSSCTSFRRESRPRHWLAHRLPYPRASNPQRDSSIRDRDGHICRWLQPVQTRDGCHPLWLGG